MRRYHSFKNSLSGGHGGSERTRVSSSRAESHLGPPGHGARTPCRLLCADPSGCAKSMELTPHSSRKSGRQPGLKSWIRPLLRRHGEQVLQTGLVPPPLNGAATAEPPWGAVTQRSQEQAGVARPPAHRRCAPATLTCREGTSDKPLHPRICHLLPCETATTVATFWG